MKLWQKNMILLAVVAVIAAVPLIFVKDTEFGGADGEAEEAIAEISPGYEPWLDSLFELPGGEMETLLFTVQAGLGAGVAGFVLGRITARPKKTDEKSAGGEEQSRGSRGEHCAAN